MKDWPKYYIHADIRVSVFAFIKHREDGTYRVHDPDGTVSTQLWNADTAEHVSRLSWILVTKRKALKRLKKMQCDVPQRGMRCEVEVAQMEYVIGGKTIWIHNKSGMTVLRIKCSGEIVVDGTCTNTCTHADLNVANDITMCVPSSDAKTGA